MSFVVVVVVGKARYVIIQRTGQRENEGRVGSEPGERGLICFSLLGAGSRFGRHTMVYCLYRTIIVSIVRIGVNSLLFSQSRPSHCVSPPCGAGRLLGYVGGGGRGGVG